MLLLPKQIHTAARSSTANTQIRALSTTRTLPAAWFNLGNMGNYGSPKHYELPANGIGSRPKDHVTKTWDKNNIQNTYHYNGMEAKMNSDMLRKNGRVEEESGGGAITRRDTHHSNRRAMVDIPEAPNPVIGMNDERGPVSCLEGER